MKRKYKRGLIILGVIVAIIISSNIILNNLISKVVANQIEKINSKGEVRLQVGKIRVNIFSGSLKISKISIKPDSLHFVDFKEGKTKKLSTSTIFMSDLKIKGFSIYNVLVNEEIIANKIIANGLNMTLFKSGNEKKVKGKETEEEDSL